MTLTYFIQRVEGFSLAPYLDTVDKWTWGWGRNLTDVGLNGEEAAEVLQALTIDDKEERDKALTKAAFTCLENDLEMATGSCQRVFNDFDIYTANRRIALISVMYNLGAYKFNGFKRMIAAIRQRDWKLAAIELRDSKRHRQITNRSNEESSMLEIG